MLCNCQRHPIRVRNSRDLQVRMHPGCQACITGSIKIAAFAKRQLEGGPQQRRQRCAKRGELERSAQMLPRIRESKVALAVRSTDFTSPASPA